jgi:mannitol 2-dehydrogenase
VPGVDLDEYKQSLIERFSNPAVLDTLARLCTDSSDRIPKFLLPVAQWQLGESGTGNVELTAAIVASWARYAEGVDENGAAIEVVDRLRDELVPLARSQRESPTAFIANRAIFGDLVDDARFVDPFVRALESLHRVGSQATYRALTAG